MYPNNKHANPLQIGEAYQRKVAEAIKAQYNYQIHYYTDKQDQYNIGESSEGFEIKYDSWIGRSGRLSIEIGEKTKIILPVFSASGIFRKDNTIWYCQGDDRYCWIFIKRELQEYYYKNRPLVISNNPPTIKKFYLPERIADAMAKRKIKL